MKRFVSVFIAPLARRLGSMAAGGIAGGMAVDPAIAARVEAWVMAGALLAVDLVVVGLRAKTQEGR